MSPDPLRPPETDEEPWSVPDDIAPARGCAVGFLLMVITGVLLVCVYAVATRSAS